MDQETTVILSTHGMSVRAWETIKEQYAQAGWTYAPDVAVFVRPPAPGDESTEEGDDVPRL